VKSINVPKLHFILLSFFKLNPMGNQATKVATESPVVTSNAVSRTTQSGRSDNFVLILKFFFFG